MEENIKVEIPCPNCGSDVPEDVCPKCSFAFSSVLLCPKKLPNGDCEDSNSTCTIKGMDWESCPVLRN